jgi:Protein of unknown function (DUF3102)
MMPRAGAAGHGLAVIGNRLVEIENQFSLMPYERLRVVAEARFFMSQSAEAMLELGKRLIQMKEAEPHGDWLDCLRQIGIEERIARRVMRSALKFGAQAEKFAGLGRAKLYELAFLDEDNIKELAEGGTVAGLELDEVERMSARELRSALREARADGVAKDELLDEKNKKIDTLSARRKHKLGSEAEARAAMCESVSEQAQQIAMAAHRLDELLTEAGEQGMLNDLPTQERLFRPVYLARLGFDRTYGTHGVFNVDDEALKAVFDDAPSGAPR